MSVFAQGGGLQSDLVFAEIGRRIKELGSELVKKVNAVFSWEITQEGKTAAQWSTYACREEPWLGALLYVNAFIPWFRRVCLAASLTLKGCWGAAEHN